MYLEQRYPTFCGSTITAIAPLPTSNRLPCSSISAVIRLAAPSAVDNDSSHHFPEVPDVDLAALVGCTTERVAVVPSVVRMAHRNFSHLTWVQTIEQSNQNDLSVMEVPVPH